MAILIVKLWFAGRVSRFFGDTNLLDGMLFTLAITPIGAALHEPCLTCCPFVKGNLTVAQKFMKLLLDVRDGTWPAS